MVTAGKVILFQGDSITDAGRSREAKEPNRGLGGGYASYIAGRLGVQYARAGLRFYNRGLGGNRVSDLYARWNEDAISLQPDLISILIGVNDAWRRIGKMPEGASDRFKRVYRHLLEETRETLPNTTIVLCEPFILPVGLPLDSWEEWRRTIDTYGTIVRELAERYDAVFVELQDMLQQSAQLNEPGYWLHDGIHASAAGHELIASKWIETVQASRYADAIFD